MQYEAFAVPLASVPVGEPAFRSADECADQISGVYEMIAGHSGEIIATYTLDCDVQGPRRSERERGSDTFAIRQTCLFLVAEFPDDVDMSTIYDGPDVATAS
jgi:hypothetical protein